jgi:hypothetical protein
MRLTIRVTSTVAILTGRIMEGAGNPAVARSLTATSQGQPTLSALVIIASQTSPKRAARSGVLTTTAGRRFSASLSE